MPELPEAERARITLESVLGRRIARVDDRDTYVCRPHAPGEIAAALVGHEFVSAHRRGKFMWLETADGPTLGLHLGMSGRIVLARGDTPRWDRFTVELDRLRREVRAAVRSAIRKGGAHTGAFAGARAREGSCPRCGHALSRSRIGGRTTYWCSACQE